jgi:phage baseplate assembly protein V
MNSTFGEAAATLQFGIVVEIAEATCRAKVRLPALDNLITHWLPVLVPKTCRDKHYIMPDVGEHVALMLDSRGEDGCILGALYSSADVTPCSGVEKHHIAFDDGTTVEYDRDSHVLSVNAVGPITIEAAGPVLVRTPKATIDAPETRVTGHLTVEKGMTVTGGGGAAASITGDIEVQGDIHVDGSVDASGTILDASGNSNHHSH